ncbi:hypothetical protein [Salinibacterium sp. ZJ450]|uniref:hypothetical protein n=1 Tax=Salinibacterium sp. ZJ450 TaxID=2708338 RepID=UPI00174BBB9A|nr:hypothetical protein [Salinibacterium sp. ZJ450]
MKHLREKDRIGVPTGNGGRWANKPHSEASEDLLARDRTASPDHDDSLSPQDARALAYQSALNQVAWSGLNSRDADDIAQEAIFDLLKHPPKSGSHAFTPGLIITSVKNKLAMALNERNNIRPEEARARRDLADVVVGEEGLLGRALISREVDEIAQRIRDSWHDPRHRPSENFHRDRSHISIDDEAAGISELPGARKLIREPMGLLDLLESGAIGRPAAKRQVWNEVAAGFGVLPVKPRSIRDAEARNARAEIDERGGVAAAAAKWLDGREVAGKLFAPWIRVSEETARDIAVFLTTRPLIAEPMWRSALDTANGAGKRVR